jgi:hypothetical protein
MYTNTHPNTHPRTPLGHQRSHRHPLPGERASRSRILLAHLLSTLQQNKPLCQLAHLFDHLAPPPLLKPGAQNLSKFFPLLISGGHHGPEPVSAAIYLRDI